MKYSLVAIALAAAAQAQTLADVPECAIPCLDDAISSETSCEKTDLVCVCENFDAIRSKATSCVIDECGSDVAINEVLPATEALCENPGSGSGGSSAGGEGSTTKAETTKAETTAAAETSAAAPTSEAAETTEEAPETTAAAEETTTVPPVVQTSAEAPVSTPSPTTVEVNGAAGLKGIGALAMVALAALAL
ncbi:hypothetical protein ACJ41O_003233 [Fusarium nematophilum]